MSVVTVQQPKILERMAGTTSKKAAGKRKAESARIEMLGRMDDRHKQYLVAGNKPELMVLASEYAEIGCPNTASQIMAEAMNL